MAKKIDLDGLGYFKSQENGMIATVEESSTASKAYAVGDRFYLNGKLCIATADIALGGTITLNTNCKLDVLGEDVSELKTETTQNTSEIAEKSNSTIRTVQTEHGSTAVPIYADKNQKDSIKSLVLSGAATSGCNKLIILDGSSDENWQKGTTVNDYGLANYAWYFGATIGAVKNNFGFTSRFKLDGGTAFANCESECFSIYGGGTNIGFRVKNSEIATVDAFRAYLSANPIMVWCQTNTNYDATAPQYYIAEIENPDLDYKCVGTMETINPLANGDSLDFVSGKLTQNGATTTVTVLSGLEDNIGNACINVPSGSMSVSYAMSSDELANQNHVMDSSGECLIEDLTNYKVSVGGINLNGVYTIPAIFYATVVTGYFKCKDGDKFIFSGTAIDKTNAYYRITFFDATFNKVGQYNAYAHTDAEFTETCSGYGGCSYARIIWDTHHFTEFSVKFSGNYSERITTLETNFEANSNVRSIAHRGGAYVVPENTIYSFKWARKQGYKYVETDVRFTSDGVAVLLHDASINRTARNADGTELSSTVNIADITYAQALDYDFGIYKGAEYAGEKIPTLAEFLTLCRNIGLYPYVELKVETEAQVQSIVDAVFNSGLINNSTFSSSTLSLLTYAKNYNGNVRILYSPQSGITNTTITEAQSLQTDSNEVAMGASFDTLTTAMVELLQQAHIPLDGVYDINAQRIKDTNVYASGFVVENGLNAGNILYNYGLNT